MKNSLSRQHFLAAPLALLLAAPAEAHPGHGDNLGFWGGVIHPFTGFDHLAAMIMVGLWAAQLPIKAKWAGPVTFVAAMIAGFGLAQTGAAVAAELAVTASLVALPVLILLARRLPLLPQFGCVALFGCAHGFAHGSEAGGSLVGFAAGMVIATMVLHLAGLAAGRMLLDVRTDRAARLR